MPASTPPGRLGKRLLLGLLLLLFVLPALQAKWSLVPMRPLGGYTDALNKQPLSWATLWDNTFQPTLEHYLNEKLGFRPWLVRLRNQLAYSGWNELLTKDIVLGKDQNLYQQGTINEALGRRYLGEEEIGFRARRLRRVQDSLQAHGTQLLFLIAPGKPHLVPQYLPDSCRRRYQPAATNYSMVCQQFAKYGVNTLDAAGWLLQLQQQGRAPYPLFPRTGTHWSGYAVSLVADSLFRRAEALTGHDLPDFKSVGPPTIVTKAAELRHTDNDLGELLNLMRDIPPYPMAYPNVVFAPPAGKPRLNALIIGDSYAQSFYGFYPYYDRLLTPDSRYWNYNEHVYWPEQTPGQSRNVADYNLLQQLHGRQLVLLVATQENLNKLGYGFIDKAFNVLSPVSSKDEARVNELVAAIKADPAWLAKVSQKASEGGVPVEQAVRQDAEYMHERER